MLMALGGLLLLGAFVCQIIILIAAFQDEIWKGVVGLLCSLYLLYYAIVEWDNANKWTILGAWLGLSIVGGILWSMGAGSMVPRPATPITPPV